MRFPKLSTTTSRGGTVDFRSLCSLFEQCLQETCVTIGSLFWTFGRLANSTKLPTLKFSLHLSFPWGRAGPQCPLYPLSVEDTVPQEVTRHFIWSVKPSYTNSFHHWTVLNIQVEWSSTNCFPYLRRCTFQWAKARKLSDVWSSTTDLFSSHFGTREFVKEIKEWAWLRSVLQLNV